MRNETRSLTSGRSRKGLVEFTSALTAQVPPAQFVRFVAVGVVNTLFGYGTYALFTALLTPVFPHGYIIASVISSVLNVTVSYLNYKWLVFRTKGNYARELFRTILVYSGSIAIGALLLPVLVYAIRRWTTMNVSAPYIAGAVLMACMSIYNFIAHKNFSFRSQA